MQNKVMLCVIGLLSFAAMPLTAAQDEDSIQVKNESGYAVKVTASWNARVTDVVSLQADAPQAAFTFKKPALTLTPEFDAMAPAGLKKKGAAYTLTQADLCKLKEESAYFAVKIDQGQLIIEKGAAVPEAPKFEEPVAVEAPKPVVTKKKEVQKADPMMQELQQKLKARKAKN